MRVFTKYEYLTPNRLSDVVRLISVLGLEQEWSFRKNEGLNATLNGKPKSCKEWFDIAREHPEFFKFNTNSDSIVLLLRFLNRTGTNGNEQYPALSVDQTQKLIDQAIALHDKQIGRLQKNGFLIPLWVALITVLASGIISYFTITSSNESIKQIEKKIDNIIENSKQKSKL